ncbi:MAG: UDP-3-O-(3-hydroxymyristoyl)glucosamine N-acyltransferase [Bacteroidales bacterium]
MKLNPPSRLEDVAGLINAEFQGNPDMLATGINEIHMAGQGDVTFVDHPKYYKKVLNSSASIILINKKVECPERKALIFSKDPFTDFNRLTRHFSPFTPSGQAISPTAQIGEHTFIQPGAFIGNNVRIGKNCIIHSNVSIYDNCIIGDGVIIHANSVIGADGFYFQKRKKETLKFHSCGRVILQDHVEIGACCTIDKGVTGDTTISAYTKLDNHIQVGHDTYIGKYCLFASHTAIAGVTRIEDNVILWGQVGVNKDLVIGEGAVVLAHSGVSKSLEGHKVYFGAPVDEARKKWKELAAIRKLPEIIEAL